MLKRIQYSGAYAGKAHCVISAPSGGKARGFAGTSLPVCAADDIVCARQWLAEGSPIADVLTMVETRRRFDLSSADCRAYAVEILWAAQELLQNDSKRNPNPKESAYAIA
jgi:hypothetical protein